MAYEQPDTMPTAYGGQQQQWPGQTLPPQHPPPPLHHLQHQDPPNQRVLLLFDLNGALLFVAASMLHFAEWQHQQMHRCSPGLQVPTALCWHLRERVCRERESKRRRRVAVGPTQHRPFSSWTPSSPSPMHVNVFPACAHHAHATSATSPRPCPPPPAPSPGVLTDHTPPREEGRYLRRDHVVRPQIERMLALREHFTLGVYSSATLKTVNRALGIIRAELMRLKKLGLADGEAVGVYRQHLSGVRGMGRPSYRAVGVSLVLGLLFAAMQELPGDGLSEWG